MSPQPLDPNDLESPTHDSSPLMPLPDAMKVRAGELAESLDLAERDAYIETDRLKEMLQFVKDVAPRVFAMFVGA